MSLLPSFSMLKLSFLVVLGETRKYPTIEPGHKREEVSWMGPGLVWSRRFRGSCRCLPPQYDGGIWIFIENICFPPFSTFMETARRTNESVRRTLRSSSTANRTRLVVWPLQRKRPIIATLENGKEARRANSKGRLSTRNIPKGMQFCLHFHTAQRRPHPFQNVGCKMMLSICLT